MKWKLLSVGLLVLSAVLGGILVYVVTAKAPQVLFGKVIIPLGSEKGYVCMGDSCVIIPRNSEFIVAINKSVNCSKQLVVYPSKYTFIYGAYCENSTVHKAMVNLSEALLR